MLYCLRSNIVYKFLCGWCNATYYGETCRHLSVRVGKHSVVSPLTGKKSKKSTAVKNHMLFCDQIVSINDVRILETSVSYFHIKVKESILISRNELILNKNEYLFTYLIDLSHAKLYFNDICYCYSCCTNVTIVS